MKFSLPGQRSNLYCSVFAANVAATVIGCHFSWSSPSLPKLQAADSWLSVNDEQASWIGSLCALGNAFGPYFAGWLINYIGRRWTILVAVVVSAVAWIVLILANSVWVIYIGRFIGGMGGGVAFLACPAYVAEVSELSVRGALGSVFAFFLVGGFMIEYAVGPYVTYTNLIIVNFIPVVIFLLLFPMIQESPHYYLRKGNRQSALESLTWLRSASSSEQIEEELTDIQNEVQFSMAKKATLSDLVSTRGNRMGLYISLSMVGGMQFSGINVVLVYAQTIFEKAHSSVSDISAIIVGLILFIFGGLSPPLCRLFGIKAVLIFSAIGMAIFQVLLGIYFYLSDNYDVSSIGWLPLASLVGYIFSYTVGFGPLPWAVMAEVFPSNVKGLAIAITVSFCYFVSFLLTKFFSNISDLLGTYTAFFFFGGCCVITLFLTIFLVPDTRNMTIPQILDLLNKSPTKTFETTKSQTEKKQYDNEEV